MSNSSGNASGAPLISIITITYNAAEEIVPTMKSLANQNFKDFEHLVIDGASSDGTPEIVAKTATPNTVIKSEPDKGLYDAMNKGLRLAKGQYVLFLNAGDSFHSPDTLRLYAEAAKKGAYIIYGDTIIVDKSRNFLSPRHLTAPERLTFKSFSNGMLICHQAFMAKREIAPLYDLSYRFSADFDWTVKCIKKTQPQNCINLGVVTIDYLNDGLTDRNKWKSLRERFRIMTVHYGLMLTILNHGRFFLRNLKRKYL